MRNKRRTTTRRRVMYGGNPAPAVMFPGDNFNPQDVYTALNNYLQAAYSINQAALAIKDTSNFQNNPDTSNPAVTGTRILQKNSALSFSTAATSFINSLKGVYGSLTSGTTIPLPPVPGSPQEVLTKVRSEMVARTPAVSPRPAVSPIPAPVPAAE